MNIDFYMIPKAELHVHLEGTIFPDHYEKVTGLSIKEDINNINDLSSFLKTFEKLFEILKTKEDFVDAIKNYSDRAVKQGIIYSEMTFDPQSILERNTLCIEELMKALVEGKKYCLEQNNHQINYIIGFRRDKTQEDAIQTFHKIMNVPFIKSIIVGIGLVHQEIENFPSKFKDLFSLAKSQGFRLTSHCDVFQPNTLNHIRDCINILDVERIDHGLHVLEDESLIQLCKQKNIGFTACPTMSLLTKEWIDFGCNSVKNMLLKGLEVSINSDDPGLMREKMVGDLFWLVYLNCSNGLNNEEIIKLAKNSFHSSFLEEEEKEKYLLLIDEYIKKINNN